MSAEAQQVLDGIGTYADNANDFDYMMAYATLNRQRRNNQQAILGFARAHELSSEDTTAQRALLEVAGEQGRPVWGERLSLSTDFRLAPIFEDSTVYELDAKMFGVASGPLLPAPRSSIETLARTDYKLNLKNLPTILGSYEFRNARGETSFPSESVVLDRNTYDTTLGFGVNPAIKLGRATLFVNPGLQFTFRRDRNVPIELNQNLFRQQVYMSTSALFNWLTIRGYGLRETGSFTRRDVTSKEYAANLEFAVGRPWGKNALITGYRIRDLQLDPIIREYFSTSTYEYIRSWRVQDRFYALAQAMRPAAEVQYERDRWAFEGRFALTRGQGFHEYDNMQTGFLISYTKPLRRQWNDGVGEVGVEFPLRFSFGIQQQSFFNFTGERKSTFLPVIKVTLF
jgi:hypothetical protein